MRALILGGNGFIGSHLVDALLLEKYSVRVFDRQPEQYRDPLSTVEYVFGEFGDPFMMSEALSDVDVVYHLVSTTVPSTSNKDPEKDISSNLIGSVRLCRLLVEEGVRRIVFLSSGGTVYGEPTVSPIPEDHSLSPISSYGIVKVAIENYLMMYQKLYGLEPVVLRGANPYGPRQGHRGIQGFIGTALHHVLRGETVTIWGDGGQTRDYMYVGDLAELMVKAGISGPTGVFNAGSGAGHSLNEVIETIADVVGVTPNVQYGEGRGFDVRNVILNIEKATARFDWSPKRSLREGIRITADWYRSTESRGLS